MSDDHEVTGGAAGPGWIWEQVSGPVEHVVAAEIPPGVRRTVRVVDPGDDVLVLGSTQPVPAAAPGPSVRRRSGGGAVLLVPGETLWVDVLVSRDDPWWDDDVGRAAHVISDAWAAALAALAVPADVHRGPLRSSPWSDVLCFAGLGPGEVTVDGRKVVGIAQRRTRAGACFQCAVALAAPGRSSVDAVGLAGADADAATAHLARTTTALGQEPASIEQALRSVLVPGPESRC